MKPGAITILIVDDSTVVRRALRMIFEEAGFVVVGEAGTGEQAVELAISLHPLIVTMDLAMPGMDGLGAVEEIMASAPTRILVVSGVPKYKGLDSSFEALSRGALELMPKPSAWPSTGSERERLVDAIRQLAGVPVVPHFRARQKERERARRVPLEDRREGQGQRPAIVAIGASTGGPTAVKRVISGLPADFGLPIVVVQHMADIFAAGFVEWLGDQTDLSVVEAAPGGVLGPGTVHVALRGLHIGVTATRRLCAIDEPPRGGHRPSVDVLFASVARAFGPAGVGVLLSGMGRDGADGLLAMASAGGLTLAQNEETCTVFGMPKAAADIGATRELLSPPDIARRLAGLSGGVTP